MDITDIKEAVFISYAWGGPLAKKEWLRQQIVNPLELDEFSVFWDRDAILYGQEMDDVVAKALSTRPINILCICDEDFVKSAFQEDSGLYRELKLIANIAHMEDVRVIPVILGEKCKDSLPDVFGGKTYLDLTMLHARGLALGAALALAARGAAQAEVTASIALQLRRADLIEKAEKYFKKNPFELYGDAKTHEVWINDRELLLPPTWMYQISRWSYRASENTLGFCPEKGIWAWNNGSTSTGIYMLGAATISAFFPDKSSDADIAAIEYCGKIIADKILSSVKETEPIILDGREIVQCLMREDVWLEKLSKLLA